MSPADFGRDKWWTWAGTVFGQQVIPDPCIPQGKLFRIPAAQQVFVHPHDFVLMHVELCPTTYERQCTMRSRLRWEERRRALRGTPVSTWPELAAWAGVRAS